MFHIIPKFFSEVKARALCRPVKFLHNKLVKLRLYGADFADKGIVMLQQESWRSVHINIGLRSGPFKDQSDSSTPDWSNYVFMEMAMYTWAWSCWNRNVEGGST